VLVETGYAGGLRVSELTALNWFDVLPRDNRVQLSITGKGGKVRQVLLPEVDSRSLLSLRGDAGENDPVFVSNKGGGRLTERAVNHMMKTAAKRAGMISIPRYRLTGSVMLTAATPSIAAPAYPRCRRRSATATYRPPNDHGFGRLVGTRRQRRAYIDQANPEAVTEIEGTARRRARKIQDG
jgi:integrase